MCLWTVCIISSHGFVLVFANCIQQLHSQHEKSNRDTAAAKKLMELFCWFNSIWTCLSSLKHQDTKVKDSKFWHVFLGKKKQILLRILTNAQSRLLIFNTRDETECVHVATNTLHTGMCTGVTAVCVCVRPLNCGISPVGLLGNPLWQASLVSATVTPQLPNRNPICWLPASCRENTRSKCDYSSGFDLSQSISESRSCSAQLDYFQHPGWSASRPGWKVAYWIIRTCGRGSLGALIKMSKDINKRSDINLNSQSSFCYSHRITFCCILW